jgi:hypothetical protein
MRQSRPELPVVIISGLIDAHECDELGDDVAFLRKPFISTDLVRLVGEQLAAGRELQPSCDA